MQENNPDAFRISPMLISPLLTKTNGFGCWTLVYDEIFQGIYHDTRFHGNVVCLFACRQLSSIFDVVVNAQERKKVWFCYILIQSDKWTGRWLSLGILY